MTTPGKGPADYLALGDWNAICDECGRKGKASEMVETWNKMKVHKWHTSVILRQPQDFVRGVKDVQTPNWTRPVATDQFVHFCTPNGTSAVPGEAEPGCAVPGYLSPLYDADSDT